MGAVRPVPYRITKQELYRFLLKLHQRGVEIVVTTPWGEDGWQIRLNNHGSQELSAICESTQVKSGGDHWALNEHDYVIILARVGMPENIQVLFDGAALGRWVDA